MELCKRLDLWNHSVWVDAGLPDMIRAMRQYGVREVVVVNGTDGI
jgi:CBS domain-containing protein